MENEIETSPSAMNIDYSDEENDDSSEEERMTEEVAEHKQRRASIQAIMKDDNLTPLERRRSIQGLMDGRRRSSLVGSISRQSSNGSNLGSAAEAVAQWYDSDSDDDDDDAVSFVSEVSSGPRSIVSRRRSSLLGVVENKPDEYLEEMTEEIYRNMRMEKRRPQCDHYERKCTIIAPCCGLAFGCRICHDECENLPPPFFAREEAMREKAEKEEEERSKESNTGGYSAPNGLLTSSTTDGHGRPKYGRAASMAHGMAVRQTEAQQQQEEEENGYNECTTGDNSAQDGGLIPSKRPVYGRASSFSGFVNRYELEIDEEDEEESHQIDRFKIAEVICRECYTRQSSKTNRCVNCNVRFGDYHCNICNLWMSNEETPYHCHDCGFCRVGGSAHFKHCHDCGMCIDVLLFHDHNCKSGKYMSNCPVCQEDLFSSREASHEMPCGHAIHWHCFEELTSFDSRCPVCKKTAETVDQMAPTWQAMAMSIALQPVPREMTKVVTIICNDCEVRSQNRQWHLLGVQCRECTSFNTTVSDVQLVGEEAAEYLELNTDETTAGMENARDAMASMLEVAQDTGNQDDIMNIMSHIEYIQNFMGNENGDEDDDIIDNEEDEDAF